MASFRFEHVRIEGFSVHLPDNVVTSAALERRIAPLYDKLGIPYGTLERLTGIHTRRMWDVSVLPSDVATAAAKQVLAGLGSVREHIGALFNCSVTRDYLEPATAAIIHRHLGLDEQSLVMDISNACLGLVDGFVLLGGLIESGVVKAGLLVSGENLSCIIEATISYILGNDSIDRDELMKLLPAFTLGCGAVAWVLCHESVSTNSHRLLGGSSRSATQYSDLCVAKGDWSFLQQTNNVRMPIAYTEPTIFHHAAALGARTWKDAREVLGWSNDSVDQIIGHQVGKQANRAFFDAVGVDYRKEFSVYHKYGNIASAALPIAFAEGLEVTHIDKGSKVLLGGFGSGLNAVFLGIEW